MILFFDSGVGGMSYMQEFLSRTTDRPCLYLADTAFFPYGEKAPEAVRERVVSLVRAAAERYTLEAIVVACNTASVVALDALRHTVSVPVVGTVPAVKPAATRTRTGHIAVLATSRTVEDPYTDDLVERFARLGKVSRLGLPRLVAAAEGWCADDPESGADPAASLGSTDGGQTSRHETERRIEEIIREDVQARLAEDVDTIVLACTHFVRFRETFSRVLGTRVAVVDSLDGVTRRLMAVLGIEDTRKGGSDSPDGSDSLSTDRRITLLRTASSGGCGGEKWTVFP
jgi:glutamate racemase